MKDSFVMVFGYCEYSESGYTFYAPVESLNYESLFFMEAFELKGWLISLESLFCGVLSFESFWSECCLEWEGEDYFTDILLK